MSVEAPRRGVPIWVWAIAIVVAVAASMFITNRPTGPGNTLHIQSNQDYVNVLRDAERLTTDRVKKFDAGGEMTSEDLINLRRAMNMFDSLSEYAPRKMGPYFLSGKIAFILGEFPKAELKMRKTIETMPIDTDPKTAEAIRATIADAHFLLAQLLFDKREYTSAEMEATAAIAEYANQPSYLVIRARSRIQLNRIPEAKIDLQQALKSDPDNAPAKTLMKFLASSS